MEYLFGLIAVIIIAIVSTGVSFLWRTSIYTRGAIFRPVGRLLDRWVEKGCRPGATFGDKVLRFIAYPLGRCIYCSSFHITYDMFFLINFAFGLGLSAIWLIILLPITHLLVIIFCKTMITGNNDMEKKDWYSMYEEENKDKLFN